MEQDVSGRPVELRDLDLTLFFRPRVVAVVGASDTEGRQNTAQWRRMRDWCADFGAQIWPVHPTKPVVDGHRTVPTLLDVPGDIDLAVILVQDVETTIAQAIAKKARFAIAFAAGFAEQGEAGRERQQRITSLVRESNLRLLGPNTNFNTFERFRDDLPGPGIGLITQSGHQGRPIFQAQELGIALSAWAPTGNEADLEFADFVRWFADSPGIGVVAAYVEAFKDARTMRLAADHAMTVGVPLVCVKVGRTAEGASMALSHTGKLTGTDAVVDAALAQHGAVRVDSLDRLIDTAQVLARRPDGPVADGVAVYSISGGTGAHMADMCAQAGLSLPPLTLETQNRLRETIPSFLRVSNPVDSGGNGAGDDRGRQLLEALVADPNIGVLICPITGAFAPMSDRLAQDLADIADATDKLICVVWGSPLADEAAYRKVLLGSSKLATFRTFGNCVTAVKAWRDWHEFRATYKSPFRSAAKKPSRSAASARGVLKHSAGVLNGSASKKLLAAYGIPVTGELVVDSAAAAVRAAKSIAPDCRVVLSASKGGSLHKGDIEGVRTGLMGAAQIRQAYAELAALSGGPVLVTEQIEDGMAEVIVGVHHDELFGPVVSLGFGGADAEIWSDVAVRVPPFGPAEVVRMLDGLRGVDLLRGWKGRPRADERAIVDVVTTVQRLALELSGEVQELEIKPLVVRAKGHGAVATQALVVGYT